MCAYFKLHSTNTELIFIGYFFTFTCITKNNTVAIHLIQSKIIKEK